MNGGVMPRRDEPERGESLMGHPARGV